MDTEVVDVESINAKSTRVKARHHTFIQDKPATSGGTDKGPMASEYWAASLAACHITTAQKIAEKRQQKIQSIKIRASTHIDGDFIKRVDLDIHVVGDASKDEVETIFRLTERICTISKATSVPIEHKITLASQAKA